MLAGTQTCEKERAQQEKHRGEKKKRSEKKKRDFIWPSHHHRENCLVVTSPGNKILSSADPDSLQEKGRGGGREKKRLKFLSPSEELS